MGNIRRSVGLLLGALALLTLASAAAGAQEPEVSSGGPLNLLAEPCPLHDSTSASGNLAGPIAAGATRTVQVTGLLPTDQGVAPETCVPAGATSVVVTISAIDPVRAGNLRLSPEGEVATGGVVNYNENGLDNANTVTVPLRDSGRLDIFANASATGVRLTALGYHSTTGTLRYNPLTPCAVADSRPTQGATGGYLGPFGADDTYPDVQVTGTFSSDQGGGNTTCGVPDGVAGVFVNLVSVGPAGGSGHLTIGAGGTDPVEPLTPFADINLNNATGAIVPLAADGTLAVDVTASTGTPTTHVRVVVLGYLSTSGGDDFFPAVACAAFDTRAGRGATGSFLGPRLSGETGVTTYRIGGFGLADQGANDGTCEVPWNATAVLINLVSIRPSDFGNARMYATGTDPTGGVLNFATTSPPMNNSNAVVVPLSDDGRLDLFTNTRTNDGTPTTEYRGVVLGYFVGQGAPDPLDPETTIDPRPIDESPVIARNLVVGGTATDNWELASVEVRITEQASGQTWDGSAFTTDPTTVDAEIGIDPAGEQATWTVDFVPPRPGDYQISAAAIDGEGDADPSPAVATVAVVIGRAGAFAGLDDTPFPSPESAPAGEVVYQGQAGLDDVEVRVQSTGGLAPTSITVEADRAETLQLADIAQSPVYDITVDDPTAMTGGVVTLPYDPTGLSVADQSDLRLATIDDETGLWVPITGTTTVDTAAATVTADVDHFSPFAVVRGAATGVWDSSVIAQQVGSPPEACEADDYPFDLFPMTVGLVSYGPLGPAADFEAGQFSLWRKARWNIRWVAPGGPPETLKFDPDDPIVALPPDPAFLRRLDQVASGASLLGAIDRQLTHLEGQPAVGTRILMVDIEYVDEHMTTADLPALVALADRATASGIFFEFAYETRDRGHPLRFEIQVALRNDVARPGYVEATLLNNILFEAIGNIIPTPFPGSDFILDASLPPDFDPTLVDTDEDGLTDCEETSGILVAAKIEPGERRARPAGPLGGGSVTTDPNEPDSDGDQAIDGDEVILTGFDSHPEVAEAYRLYTLLTGKETFYAMISGRPDLGDTDDDTLLDSPDPETSVFEVCPGTPDFRSSPFLVDTDDDGNDDAVECVNGTDPGFFETGYFGVPDLIPGTLFVPESLDETPGDGPSNDDFAYILDRVDHVWELGAYRALGDNLIVYDADYNCVLNCDPLDIWAAGRGEFLGLTCFMGRGRCTTEADLIRDKVEEIVTYQQLWDTDDLVSPFHIANDATAICLNMFDPDGVLTLDGAPLCSAQAFAAIATGLDRSVRQVTTTTDETVKTRTRGRLQQIDSRYIARVVARIVQNLPRTYRDADPETEAIKLVTACMETEVLEVLPLINGAHPCEVLPIFGPGFADAGGAMLNDLNHIALFPNDMVLTHQSRARASTRIAADLVTRGLIGSAEQWYFAELFPGEQPQPGKERPGFAPCDEIPLGQDPNDPNSLQCDEYPLFSSTISGPGPGLDRLNPRASLLPVPRRENLAEGNAYSAFITKCPQIDSRINPEPTPFIVVPQPFATGFICREP